MQFHPTVSWYWRFFFLIAALIVFVEPFSRIRLNVASAECHRKTTTLSLFLVIIGVRWVRRRQEARIFSY